MGSDSRIPDRLYEEKDGEILITVLREKFANTVQGHCIECISIITVKDFKQKFDDICNGMINSEKSPLMIIIAFTVKNYWRAIKIDIDYINRKLLIVFDDPCGSFPDSFLTTNPTQESFLSVIKSNVEKLIRKQINDKSFCLPDDHLDKVILNVKGKNLKEIRSDSGPIIFSHVNDYLNGVGRNGQYVFTIPEHTKQGYKELVKNVRLEHFKYIDRPVEDKPQLKTNKKNKVLDQESCLKQLKLDLATLAATSDLIDEIIIGNSNLNDNDYLEKCNKIGINIHKVNWNQDDPNCIRNKHGYRNRFGDKGNQINQSGARIDFETIGRLKDLAQNDECKCLLVSHRDKVIQSLSVLKQKINFIQSGSNKKSDDETIGYLLYACAFYHDFICINRTIQLVDVYLTKPADMNNKLERYYVGYVMSQLGELAKEISENLKEDTSKKDAKKEVNPMMLFFRNIGCFRQQIKNHSSWVPDGKKQFLDMHKSLDEIIHGENSLVALYNEINTEIFQETNEKPLIEKMAQYYERKEPFPFLSKIDSFNNQYKIDQNKWNEKSKKKSSDLKAAIKKKKLVSNLLKEVVFLELLELEKSEPIVREYGRKMAIGLIGLHCKDIRDNKKDETESEDNLHTSDILKYCGELNYLIHTSISMRNKYVMHDMTSKDEGKVEKLSKMILIPSIKEIKAFESAINNGNTLDHVLALITLGWYQESRKLNELMTSEMVKYENNYKDAFDQFNTNGTLHSSLSLISPEEVESDLSKIWRIYWYFVKYDKALTCLKLWKDYCLKEQRDCDSVSYHLAEIYHLLGKYEEALAIYNQNLRVSKLTYKEDHPDIASLLNNVAVMQGYLGQFEKALESFEEVLRIRRNIYTEKHPIIATTLSNMASELESVGRYENALEKYSKALNIIYDVYKVDHPHVAIILNNMGGCFMFLGQYGKALEHYEKVLEIQKKVYDADHPEIGTTFNNIGSALQALGRYEESLKKYVEALQIRKKVFKDNHLHVSITHNNIGGVLQYLSRYEEALGHYTEAIRIVRIVFGENHPDLATKLNNMAVTYISLGRVEDALQTYNEVMRILKIAHKDKDHPYIASTLNNITTALVRLSRFEEALETCNQALVMRKNVYENEHVSIAISLNNMAEVLRHLGRNEEALDNYKEAVRIFKKELTEYHLNVSTTLENIANALKSLKRHEEALIYYVEMLPIQKKLLKEDHPSIAMTLNNMAMVYESLGRNRESLNSYLQALSIFSKHLVPDHKFLSLTRERINRLEQIIDSEPDTFAKN